MKPIPGKSAQGDFRRTTKARTSLHNCFRHFSLSISQAHVVVVGGVVIVVVSHTKNGVESMIKNISIVARTCTC